jgi:large subunit ribosomal protein L28
MARTCLISGKGTVSGHNVPRKGQAKKHGGVGQHIGVKTKRTFKTNMVTKKIFVPELGKSVKIRISTRALKSVTKNGLLPMLKKNGLKIKGHKVVSA